MTPLFARRGQGRRSDSHLRAEVRLLGDATVFAEESRRSLLRMREVDDLRDVGEVDLDDLDAGNVGVGQDEPAGVEECNSEVD